MPLKNRDDETKTTVQRNFIEKTKYTQKLLVIELEKHLKHQKKRKTDKTEGKLRHVNKNQNGQSELFKHRFLTLLYVSAWLFNTRWIIIIKSS